MAQISPIVPRYKGMKNVNWGCRRTHQFSHKSIVTLVDRKSADVQTLKLLGSWQVLIAPKRKTISFASKTEEPVDKVLPPSIVSTAGTKET